MSIHASLSHITHYKYERKVGMSPQIIRLRPAPHCRNHILSYSLKVTPEGHFMNWQQDAYGNYLARVVYPEKIDEFKVEVNLVTEMAVFNPFDFFVEEYAEEFPFAYSKQLLKELKPFMEKPDQTPLLLDYVKQIDLSPKNTVDFLVDLNQRLQQRIEYLIRMEPGVQKPEETLKKGSGSCRDSAWLMIHILRHLGFAARFASGYLIQLKPDVKSLDGPSGTEVDFTDLHAWCEVFLPGAGWIGFDPTSGLLTGESHIPLACAPEPVSAAPIEGGVEACDTEFEFHMEVKRVLEHPRITFPYNDEAWSRVNKLGLEIDQRLKDGNVRLTMGGEPTFVSIDDMDGAEWTNAAVGPTKLRLSEVLLKRLSKVLAPGGFLHYGQGKWYPGESLPRWALSCYYRKDEQPLWRDPQWLADVHKDYGFGHKEAQMFVQALTVALDVTHTYVQPAYEDVWYYLWKEQKLPVNVNPLESRLKDPEERHRISRIFEKGLNSPVGYVLPLQHLWQGKASSWKSGPWFKRQKNLFLIPGDSPLGLRLPLDSLPWVRQLDYPYITALDPIFDRSLLMRNDDQMQNYLQRVENYIKELQQRNGDFGPRKQELPPESDDLSVPAEGMSDAETVRTALCVQPRNGKLYVFMPPVRSLEEYLDLVSAIEATAAKLKIPVILEGEKPPSDHRVEHFSITPDPGVIEVNISPSSSWGELVHKTELLYEEARLSRLGTDKFLLDGRHTGTGGGNHIVIGGATPADSPFLRRPDLLRSMVSYWLNHPSLSYLFSGLFVGPTSQAPRMDEARSDSVYELEIACKEVDHVQSSEIWMVDRIFRNILTDVTGNTHRAEFCIDKLYNPDSSSGRLGLVELRSFEMPPHARMSLAQQLLIRGLIALFWDKPYKPENLSRWGNDLHDRYMLPHFLRSDFQEVLRDLNAEGLAFEELWFESHFEFRFPFYGEVQYRDMSLELRGAIEPWHVLGEEGTSGGTVRFVDSSLERLQVKVRNWNPDRYVLACNGVACPLVPTGTRGEFVGGVKFRAWRPPSCLHPTLMVDAPLNFDIIDTWNHVTVAGCTYYVEDPAGRNTDVFPVNSYEAESRRLSRFSPHERLRGKWDTLPRVQMNKDFPATLDLRLFKV